MKILRAFALDLLGVAVFVVIGRRNHDEGAAASGIAATSAPFVLALAGAWAAGLARSRAVASVPFGLWVWAFTVAVGMGLRRAVFDRGTAAAFVVVATLFLGCVLVGWRAVGALGVPWGRHRAAE